MKKAIINSGIGSKVICAVTDNVTLEAAPIMGTDNGDGTASLLVTSSMAVLPDTVSGDLADINAASASINDKLPVLVGGKIPVDASVSIDPAGLATEATQADVKTAVEALAVATPDTAGGDLADINAAAASIDGKLPALVGGKIPVDASVSIDPAGLATQATLADILAKIIAAPSTEAKQDLILTALGLIATEATTGGIKTATEALAALISAGALAVSLGELPDTAAGDLADINAASASIDGKLPALVGGKIPVDASVSIDSVDIGDVDITEFPAGNLGQQAKAASLSVAPATDITDPTYIGDVKFGEELPAGTQLIGKVGIDQTTPGTTNLVNVNGGASQTADIKVTLDSETIAVTGPLTDAQLSAQSLAKDSSLTNILNKIIAEPSTAAKQDLIITALGLIATEATASNIETATEALAALISSGALKVSMATLPDTSTGSLFNMAIDINTMQPDIAAAKSDIGTMKTDIATAKADISAMKADIAAIRAILES